MIARFWIARATPENATRYVEHLRNHVIPALRDVQGYAGAALLERDEAGEVEIVVMTWWESLDAVRRFAGDDHERAVVADEAAALLIGFDERVRHYELVARDAV
jgi:heme-degrading monooxygenase HmoA